MPDRAKSKSQFRLFKGIAHGSIAPKGSLTASKAEEMLSGQHGKGLPERKTRRKTKFPLPHKMK